MNLNIIKSKGGDDMIFQRFDEMKNSFTKSEEKLKNYIVENLEKIKSCNASELANETGISQATIVRFSKKLGYKGFPEMRIALNKEEDQNQGGFNWVCGARYECRTGDSVGRNLRIGY